MSGARHTVDLDAMAEVVTAMGQLDGRLDGWLAELDAVVADLHLSWSGEGAKAQAQAHQEWVRGAQEMATALRALRAVANTAHGNYTRTVETNVRMWP